LARLREDLIAFYRPVGSEERMAVERIALARQSMLRAARLEASLFANPPGEELHSVLETEAFKVFLRYQAQAERSYRSAVKELLSLQAERPFLSAVPDQPAPARQAQPQAPAVPPSPPRAPTPAPAAAARASAANLALRL
ncbi:MAG TPA: hypothetical protein VME43_20555, partial [Bryobacteraceae bacterium]|nr:hypothetical protein [Bryobacteraceae bacterium]